jgi:uncharacterized protein (TIGR02996 family)
MNTLDALLAGIVADPLDETRWLVLADWLEENDDPRRAELLRLHRKLLATCCEPGAPERAVWQARVTELLAAKVQPCAPRETLTLPGGVLMPFTFVPPGAFLMGGTVEDNETPVHRVTLTRGYFLGVYPVTQAQWAAVMGTDPSNFKGPNRPVESVSWEDARAFCTALSGGTGRRVELPTEAQWEYACRAGTTTEYHCGDVLSTDLANYDGNYSWNGSPKGAYREETTDVGSFPPNPWGLCDLHGNVWEWCADEYGPYTGEDRTDPEEKDINSDNSSRVLRGGSWYGSPQYCRAAYRGWFAPDIRNLSIGFRVCFRLD